MTLVRARQCEPQAGILRRVRGGIRRRRRSRTARRSSSRTTTRRRRTRSSRRPWRRRSAARSTRCSRTSARRAIEGYRADAQPEVDRQPAVRLRRPADRLDEQEPDPDARRRASRRSSPATVARSTTRRAIRCSACGADVHVQRREPRRHHRRVRDEVQRHGGLHRTDGCRRTSSRSARASRCCTASWRSRRSSITRTAMSEVLQHAATPLPGRRVVPGLVGPACVARRSGSRVADNLQHLHRLLRERRVHALPRAVGELPAPGSRWPPRSTRAARRSSARDATCTCGRRTRASIQSRPSGTRDARGSEEYFATPPLRYFTLRLNLSF